MPTNKKSNLRRNKNTLNKLKRAVQNKINFHQTHVNRNTASKREINRHKSTIYKLDQMNQYMGPCIWEIKKRLKTGDTSLFKKADPDGQLGIKGKPKYCDQFWTERRWPQALRIMKWSKKRAKQKKKGGLRR